MTKNEKNAELTPHREIILVTIDYILKGIESELVHDQREAVIEYYAEQRHQTEKYYLERRLDRPQRKLAKLIEFPQRRDDLDFTKYLKEKTGYKIDVFENIRKRTDVIIEQNQIKNSKDLNIIVIFLLPMG